MNNSITAKTSDTIAVRSPVYFDRMIDAFHSGNTGRHAHLGHWEFAANADPLNKKTHSDSFEAAQRRMNDQLISMSDARNGTRILDVACGFGGLIQQLNETLADVELLGINIDDRQLEICQQLRPANGNTLRWQQADACDLPFADSSFNTVFCVESMFHFSCRQTFLAEANRILKPGGKLVVTDFAATPSPVFPAFCIEALLNDGYGPWPDLWCTNGSALQLLQNGNWNNLQHLDATVATLPSYQYVVPGSSSFQRDPGDQAARSALLLQWLHQNDHLRYDYVAATAAAGTELATAGTTS